MIIDFWKCESNHNDFILIEKNSIKDLKRTKLSQIARLLTDRRGGIGSDGFIIFERKQDINIYVVNRDGTYPEMCINGIFSSLIYAKELYCIKKGTIKYRKRTFEFINTDKNLFKLEVTTPSLDPKNFIRTDKKRLINEKIKTSSGYKMFSFVSVGNPHAIIFSADTEKIDICKIGKEIENNKIFVNKTNVEFASIKNRSKMFVRFWERGVGETMSCGSGTLAVAYLSYILGYTNSALTVNSPGGFSRLSIHSKITMEQESNLVFKGQVDI